jgi:phosphonate transport system ATP-binding protein
MNAPLLVFRRVGKVWPNGTRALRDVSREVARGEFVVLLGPSGAGKSTLLRMVNGLALPSEGEILFDGVRVGKRSLPSIRRQVAMVHQNFSLVERLSVASNILSGSLPAIALWRSVAWWYPPPLRQRAWRLACQVGLSEESFFRRVATLSGGQQQRVGVARALILEPRLLLADEPVASLDPRTSEEILGLIRDLARQHGTAVLCSLHQLDLARRFADRIVALSEGGIRFDGAPEAFDDETATAIYQGAAHRLHPAERRTLETTG